MDYSVGVLELKSIAMGVQAADDALKAAGISLISAQPICPGKFELIITGELAQVNAAFEKIRNTYTTYLIDSTLIGRIEPSVVKALMGAQPESTEGAIGTIETYSIASAILAADTAVKSSRVEIVELRSARGVGGKGIVFLTGEIADVTAAVENGSRYAKEQGVFVASTVIGSPHKELWNFL
ncbi:MAG TPA: BMC domain-containing protein [Caproiciproducens sp.]|nr:BMC domain-containing protein [Caproiciproducens sp.]